MLFIDGHADTVSELLDGGKALCKNDLHIDLSRIPKGYTQVFAAYIAKDYYDEPMARAEAIVGYFKAEIEKNCDRISLCTNNKERLLALKDGKTAAFLSLEGGEPIKCLEDVERLYDLGIRISSLTWNYENGLAGGADSNGRLTAFGEDVVREFEKKGIILDLSHLNRESFWDVMKITTKPMLATHSCSDSVSKHRRNLTDEQFIAICEKGGVVGINFYPEFLTGSRVATADDILLHIDRFLSLGGEDHIGLGSDFDGVDYLPKDLSGVESMNMLVQKFEEHGYNSRLIEKICYANFERILSLM